MNHTPNDNEVRDLREKYWPILVRAVADEVGPADPQWVTPLLLAGIGSRETWWGYAPGYRDYAGTPDNREDDRGDGGHGWGLLQADDRAWPAFIRSGKWSDRFGQPRTGRPTDLYDAARFAVDLLLKNERYLRKRCPGRPDEDYIAGAVAAYNCGAGNVRHAWAAGQKTDARTAGHDYSEDVFALVEFYRGILGDDLQDPEPATEMAETISPALEPESKETDMTKEELDRKVEELKARLQAGAGDAQGKLQDLLELIAAEGEDFARGAWVGLVFGDGAFDKVEIRGNQNSEKFGFETGVALRAIVLGILAGALQSKNSGEIAEFFGLKR